MATTLERLDRIRNHSTLYELAVSRGESAYLVQYTRKSRSALLHSCRKFGGQLVKLTGAESLVFAKRAADGATLEDWRIRYTGRTEHDAIVGGELPFIRDIPTVA